MLMGLAFIMLVGLAGGVLNYYTEFGNKSFDVCKDMPTDAQAQRCFGSKMRKERNIYMNFLGCAIYFSLHALAPLIETNGKSSVKRD